MSSAFDQPIVSVFDEIPTLSKESADVYGCLLNNGLCMIQPEIGMDLDVVKKAMGWYYCLVRAVLIIQSPQMAFIDVCLGEGLTSPSFREVFS